MNEILLRVSGEVDEPLELTFDDLCRLSPDLQVADVSQLDPARKGQAIHLNGLLDQAKVRDSAQYIGLHSSTDDFHASIPLAAVRDQAHLIYRLDDGPLPLQAGGPARFLIPNPAACRTDEVDECASVKFVDHIELTAKKGHDHRPDDEDEHEELHRQQQEGE